MSFLSTTKTPTKRSRLLELQDQRFRTLLNTAWESSPFYRELWSSHNISQSDLSDIAITDLPTVNKIDIQKNFSRVITDPRIAKTGVSQFIKNPQATNDLLKEHIAILHSHEDSGTIFPYLHDTQSWQAVVSATATRVLQLPSRPFSRTRIAYIGTNDTHQTTSALISHLPKTKAQTLIISALSPIKEIVQSLNEFQPEHLIGFPSILETLARKQIAGRMSIVPKRIIATGEPVGTRTQTLCREAWSIMTNHLYGCAAVPCLAASPDPDTPTLNLFEDLTITEIVGDKHYPAPPGAPGKLLITNLVNKLQPIIRYEMPDILQEDPRVPEEDERKGSPFRRIHPPFGRMKDLLWFQTFAGTNEFLHPLSLSSFQAPGLHRYQFIRHGIRGLTMLVEMSGSPETVFPKITKHMDELLEEKKLTGAIDFRIEPVTHIAPNPQTGKLRLVIQEDE